MSKFSYLISINNFYYLSLADHS